MISGPMNVRWLNLLPSRYFYVLVAIHAVFLLEPLNAHRIQNGSGVSKALAEMVEIGEGGHLVARKDLRIRTRVVGMDESCGETLRWEEVALWVRVGDDAAWELSFHDYGRDWDPRKVLTDRDVAAGQRIDFGARGKLGYFGSWSPSEGRPPDEWNAHRWTLEPTKKVEVLKHGERLPARISDRKRKGLPDYLAQFVSENQTVILGRNELLYLFELGRDKQEERFADLRDLAVIVMIGEAKSEAEPLEEPEDEGESNPVPLVAKGVLSGFDSDTRYWRDPSITITLTGLGSNSVTYLRAYRGNPHENPAEFEVIRESCVLIGGEPPQDRAFVLNDTGHYFNKEGPYTLELIHEDSSGSMVLGTRRLRIERSGEPRWNLLVE